MQLHRCTVPTLLFTMACALLLAPALRAGSQGAPPAGDIGKLLAADAQRLAAFGEATALSGGLAMVGAPRDDHADQDAGAVYVFREVGGLWQQEAQWFGASERLARFGDCLSISGERVMVGAPLERAPAFSEGAAYVFHYVGGAWVQEARLVHSGYDYANLGHAVGLAGDIAVAGAPLDFAGGLQSGAAHVFSLGPAGWSIEATLIPAGATGIEGFGRALAIDGERVAIGAPSAPTGGAVYIFERVGGVWSERARLAPGAGSAFDAADFGASVDLEGDTLAIACPSYHGSPRASGMAFVYREVAGTWIEEARLEASDIVGMYNFSCSLALDGERLVVGGTASAFEGQKTGAAYMYERVGTSWIERRKFVHSDALDGDALGDAVAADAGRSLVGAPFRDDAGLFSGAAYFFRTDVPSAVGLAYCPGDGSGTPCPCGNESPLGEGRGCVTSRAVGARLTAIGSTSLAAEDLAIYVHDLPVRTSCLLFAGSVALGGSPFGDGLLCAGGAVVRLGVARAGTTGVLAWGPLLDQGTPWGPGSSVHLQAWFRDATAGPCAQGSNLSGALEILLTP